MVAKSLKGASVMSNESGEKERGSRTGLVIALVAVLVLYVLSPIPVLMVMDRWFGVSLRGPDNWLTTAVQVVYFPLIIADQRVPGVREFYESYGKLIGYR